MFSWSLAKTLSSNIHSKQLSDVKEAADAARKAHLELTGANRAGCWLHATPSVANRNKMDPLLFRTSVLRWLRVAPAPEDSICPLCGGIMDKFGDHALVCCSGGDRTKRHNLLRNCVYHFAISSGLGAELEKPGLLQPRPWVAGGPENGTTPSDPQNRRPADVYIARWRRGTPMALDFAVTSGMRDIPGSIRDASSAVTSYEDFKRTYQDTERACVSEGVAFTPMVVEAVGGAWGPAASRILSQLAKDKVIQTGENQDKVILQLYQALGVILHRENARAVLKRLRSHTVDVQDLLQAAATLQADAADASAYQ